MTEKDESWSDRAWNWVVRITGLGVFVFSATINDDAQFSIAFLGIFLAVMPVAEVRQLLRNWRRSGKDDPQ